MRSKFRAVTAALLTLVLIAGCTPQPAEEPAPEPKVAPPVIGEAGVLRVGVDLEYPPFAGTDKGQDAGIDIDVAAALANELGLSMRLVQVAPSDVATALAGGDVDVVMSVPFNDAAMVGSSIAGSYITNAPAFFASAEESAAVTLDTLADRRVGAQQGSPAFWMLAYELGDEAVVTFPTLREAFEAAEAGNIDVIGCDAIVGAYIAEDFESMRFAGQIASATPLSVAVGTEATELGQVVREALDTLAANGILDTIRTKWVGDLPELSVEASGTPTE